MDVGIADGRIACLEPAIRRGVARRVVDARGKLVIPGMIDTHAHVYEHVTGSFGLNPDLVGVRAGVTTVVDQGAPAPSRSTASASSSPTRRRRASWPSSRTTSSAGWWATVTRRCTGRAASTCARRCGRSTSTAASSRASRRMARWEATRAGVSRRSASARRLPGRPVCPCTFISAGSGRMPPARRSIPILSCPRWCPCSRRVTSWRTRSRRTPAPSYRARAGCIPSSSRRSRPAFTSTSAAAAT